MAGHGSKDVEEENGIGPIRRLLIIGAGPTSLGMFTLVGEIFPSFLKVHCTGLSNCKSSN
jgi:hypothetical protein